MAIMAKKGAYDGPGENVFWTTMSDMMLGLFIVFLVLFLVTLTGFTDSVATEQQRKVKVIADFTKELDNILLEDAKNFEIDKLTGDIKITNLEMFETGSAVLSPQGRAFLDKLIPLYVNKVFSTPELIEKVDSIVVQGHTDSQMFKGAGSGRSQFILNMNLSTQRANAVAEYIFKTGVEEQYKEQLTKMLVVEGKSYNSPIRNSDGKEDYMKSRRVELRLKTKKTNVIDLLIGVVDLDD